MSSWIYPASILGLSFGVIRTPQWNTGFQQALSGKVSTIANRAYPLIHFELDYELLRDDISTSDFKALVGLINAVQGRYDTFLFNDPDFHSVTAQAFGTSDGTTTAQYQLVAAYGNSGGPSYNEIIQNLNGTPTLYDNGSAISSSNYTIGSTGLVQFSTSPLTGHSLTWTGSFYYRCRFDDDAVEFTKFVNQWWKGKTKFTSVIL